MTTAVHKKRIAALLQVMPNAACKDFRGAIERAVKAETPWMWDDNDDDREMLKERVTIYPDAYLIRPEMLQVHAYEVMATHKHSQGKYQDALWAIDAFGWELRVFLVDAITGGMTELDWATEAFCDIEAMRC